jgi:potassium efflux system protein
MSIVRDLANSSTTLRANLGGCGAGILAILLFIGAAECQAQTPTVSELDTAAISATPDLTAARIKSKIDEIEARKDIDVAVRDQALALYRKALGQLEVADANNAAAAKFQDAIQGSPKRTAEIKKQLAARPTSAGGRTATLSTSIAQLPLSDVEQRLNTTQGEVAKLKSELDHLETTLREIASRPTTARTEQTTEKKKLDELVEPRATGNSNEPSLLADARRASITAERLAVSTKVNLLEQELISLPARQALVTASRDLAAARLDILKKQVPVLEARINELRKSDALQKQAQADNVTRQLSGQHPLLENYAKTTSDLHQKQAELTRSIEDAQSKLTGINAEIGRVKESLSAAQQILEVGSVGAELGVFLREMRAQLPPISVLRAEVGGRDAAIVDARLQQLNLDQRRRILSDPERAFLRRSCARRISKRRFARRTWRMATAYAISPRMPITTDIPSRDCSSEALS